MDRGGVPWEGAGQVETGTDDMEGDNACGVHMVELLRTYSVKLQIDGQQAVDDLLQEDPLQEDPNTPYRAPGHGI